MTELGGEMRTARAEGSRELRGRDTQMNGRLRGGDRGEQGNKGAGD